MLTFHTTKNIRLERKLLPILQRTSTSNLRNIFSRKNDLGDFFNKTTLNIWLMNAEYFSCRAQVILPLLQNVDYHGYGLKLAIYSLVVRMKHKLCLHICSAQRWPEQLPRILQFSCLLNIGRIQIKKYRKIDGFHGYPFLFSF